MRKMVEKLLMQHGMELRVEKIMPVFLGLLFVVIGNYLPKCKQSYTVGIKIPFNQLDVHLVDKK